MNPLNLHLFTEKSVELANYIVALHRESNPKLHTEDSSKELLNIENAVFHLKFLEEALTLGFPELYINYNIWAATLLESRNIPKTDILNYPEYVQQAVFKILGSEFSDSTNEYIKSAKEKLQESRQETLSYFTADNPLRKEAISYLDYLLQGNRTEATQLITALIDQGVSIKAIYQYIFQDSQYEVGRLWHCNKISVVQEHYCTAATQYIISGLYRHIFSPTRKGKTMVACSIHGDLHEFGIRMVSDFFEMEGWDTHYLGSQMTDIQLEEALEEYKADVLAISVTLPIHVSRTASLIKKIRSNEHFSNLKIMVGGYPFLTHQDLWSRMGADAFAQNADQAILKANQLVNL
ncbi:cobalamin-dependent protein [Aquiflexum sp. TKW24L]|uniref:cobalamin B12-binding domain-containing protein n=1 Tax=Aquiflexum sp. TKW24L TaxID=2942212 RepID=UPI00201BACB8|nr:cobalamin-dependent protein [Aquiflexum sp. TKW24L]MCL6261056.1 cobalamin-dependent protein [Aquiflexum sp. TKW24L]